MDGVDLGPCRRSTLGQQQLGIAIWLVLLPLQQRLLDMVWIQDTHARLAGDANGLYGDEPYGDIALGFLTSCATSLVQAIWLRRNL